MKLLYFTMIMLLSIILYPQEKQFQKACKKNTKEAYTDFIDKYPNSNFTEEAAFKKASLYNSTWGYQQFLKKYPSGNFSIEAKSKICKIEYLRIEKSKDVNKFKKYLRTYSDCNEHLQMAQDKLTYLNYTEACAINTVEGYKKFISQNPVSKYTQYAKDEIKGINDQRITKGLSELKKLSYDYKEYEIGEMEQSQIPLSCDVASNLKYFTKAINGRIGDVELSDDEIADAMTVLYNSLEMNFMLKTKTKLILNGDGEVRLLIFITSTSSYTYIDRQGKPWAGVSGHFFVINTNNKELLNFERVSAEGKDLKSTVRNFGNEVASTYYKWLK